MASTIDLETAQELAADLAGSLEHLADMHAMLAALDKNRENRLMASTLSGLLRHARALERILEPSP